MERGPRRESVLGHDSIGFRHTKVTDLCRTAHWLSNAERGNQTTEDDTVRAHLFSMSRDMADVIGSATVILTASKGNDEGEPSNG